MIVADVGVFPTANRVGVGWYPSYSIRAGIGVGTSTISGWLFVDCYSFGLSEPGGLHSYLGSGAARRDLAIYPGVWIYHVLFLGVGMFTTHSDHVLITSMQGIDPWTGGDVNGVRLFGTIGLTWDFKLLQRLSVPVGIYFRNSGYAADNVLIGIRTGLDYQLR